MLPIFDIRERLRQAAAGTEKRLILQAPTGSGKSTKIPQFLVDDGLVPEDRQVVVLQPRRLPTRMLAARIAQERGENLGETVGYQIRFDRVESAKTRIKFVTEGLLLRQLLGDKKSSRKIGAVVFDEFHERHLYSDLTLSLALEIQRRERPDLLIVVMSATLDTEQLQTCLTPCEVLTAEGRAFPIEIDYFSSAQLQDRTARFVRRIPVWEHAAAAFRRAFAHEPEGDFLIFMPGAYEINRTIEAIAGTPEGRDCELYPLYGDLSAAAQDRAVAPSAAGTRKVVVATNVAETSLTIPGIRVVIDSGLARQAHYDPHRGVNMLLVEPISKSSAEQRAGRAGRTAPGYCLRLWSKTEQEHRAPRDLPEIRRVELCETLLLLKSGGIGDLTAFPWFEAPPQDAVEHALETLRSLGALDSEDALTPVGARMAAFPLHPRYARMFLAASQSGCLESLATIAALAQSKDIVPADAGTPDLDDSDFFCRLKMLAGTTLSFPMRQILRLREQFLKIARAQGLNCTDTAEDLSEALRRCLLLGFVSNLAKRIDRGTLRCRLVNGRGGELRKTSAVRQAEFLVAAQIDEIQARGETTVYLSLATAVRREWLDEYYGNEIQSQISAVYDAGQKRVIVKSEKVFRGLVLDSKETPDVVCDAAAGLLAKEVLAGHLKLEAWDERVEAWINKVNFAAKYLPELGIAPIDGEARQMMIEEICFGATSYKEIREKSPWKTLHSWLSREQAMAMEKMLPDSLSLPRKKHPAKIVYTENCEAVLAATVQELYDCPGTLLRICNRKVPLLIEVQSPAHRTFQRTRDLDAFWKTSYEGVKKELRGRYPKHEWR
ncbi:MAG: ATP-dependent helicase HrpB [Opitutales bacterium]|nr:ATP-dependent helicase HrpB [Opitutales bacterium]